MGNWGTAETAPDNEKIKAEVNDYLKGLNSCAIIDYETYSEAFDFIMERMDKLTNMNTRTPSPTEGEKK